MLPDSPPYMKSDEAIARQLSELQKKVEGLDRQRSGANRLIDSAVLAAPAATVTFANIPNIYDHLLILYYVRSTRAAAFDYIRIRFNGDVGNNYDWLRVQMSTAGFAPGGLVGTNEMEVGLISGATAPANTFDMGCTRINSYGNTSNHKSVLGMSGTKTANALANLNVSLHSGWWRAAAAIATILLFPIIGPNFDTGSRFDLYGIQGGA